LAVAFSHHFLASRIQGTVVHAVGWIRTVEIWVRSFVSFYLFKDFFTKMPEWDVFTCLSSSNHLR
jgi:hypothetical protein